MKNQVAGHGTEVFLEPDHFGKDKLVGVIAVCIDLDGGVKSHEFWDSPGGLRELAAALVAAADKAEALEARFNGMQLEL